MKKNIKLTLSAFLIAPCFVLFAADIQKVEPPHWWTGMQHTELQLLIYGDNISSTDAIIDYPGIEIKETIRVDNLNYLFLIINIDKKTEPGIFKIIFKTDEDEDLFYDYPLKERVAGSMNRRGFSTSDVLYMLMPDRFANGDPGNDNYPGMLEKANRNNPDGRHGGDIKGISERVNYFSELGVTGLWINPLLENNNPEYSYHGYAITNFYKIDPRFGTNKSYKSLVDICHANGLKVVMDMIFNHCSIHHWMIQDLPSSNWIHEFDEFTKSNFRISSLIDPHASQYDQRKLLTGWFDHHMADLDQRNELLALYLIQNSVWWIEFANLDGIRVDTQPYAYKEFITQWSDYVFAEYPNFNVVGETWLQKEPFVAYFQKDAKNLDGYNSGIPTVTDFPMYYALSKAFVESDSWTGGIARLYYVLSQDMLYANAASNLIFCDNHDLDRIFTSLKENMDSWKMAIGALLTIRGTPTLYYGSEIAMTGKEHDGHGLIRKDFPGGWIEDERNAFNDFGRTAVEKGTFNYLQTLLKWRKTKSVIHTGKLMQFIPEDNVYVYFRYNEKDCVMVAFNNSKNELKALDTEKYRECMGPYKFAKNVVTGETVHYLDAITIPPKSVLILDLEK
jgi:glycosidase